MTRKTACTYHYNSRFAQRPVTHFVVVLLIDFCVKNPLLRIDGAR